MMDPNKAAPMGAPGAPGAAPAAGPVVCIASQPDGSFMVYPEGQEDGGQTAQDVDGALELAEQMLTGQADDGDGSSATAQDADDLFTQGFNGVRQPLNRS
jgi:hypothetical protein